MTTFIERILNDPDLVIDKYRDKQGRLLYEGSSEKYVPGNAISDSAWKCLLKFDIPLWEQKRLAELMQEKPEM